MAEDERVDKEDRELIRRLAAKDHDALDAFFSRNPKKAVAHSRPFGKAGGNSYPIQSLFNFRQEIRI
ncbi:MAG: hypothetical protein HY646_07955 [Acidobacteria bacterium]|nr:hypothetical protein [Acidobacteriota bacterium]